MAALGCPRSFEDSRPLCVSEARSWADSTAQGPDYTGRGIPEGTPWAPPGDMASPRSCVDLEHVGSLIGHPIASPSDTTRAGSPALSAAGGGGGYGSRGGGGPGYGSQLRLSPAGRESRRPPEVLPTPRWFRGGWAGGQAADSRQFAWAVPADVYSQPREEGGSCLCSARGRGPSCRLSDWAARRAGAEGRGGTGGLLGGWDCSVGSRSARRSICSLLARLWGASLPRPAFLPPSPPPSHPGQQRNNHSPSVPILLQDLSCGMCLLPTRSAPTSRVFRLGY